MTPPEPRDAADGELDGQGLTTAFRHRTEVREASARPIPVASANTMMTENIGYLPIRRSASRNSESVIHRLIVCVLRSYTPSGSEPVRVEHLAGRSPIQRIQPVLQRVVYPVVGID